MENFNLRSHLVLVMGDSPAISKLIYMTGHNGYSPYRFCTIKGTPYRISYKFRNTERNKTQYYYPLTPPRDTPPDHPALTYRIYDPDNLPCCTNAGFVSDAREAAADETGRVTQETGIKYPSILFHLPTIRYPYCFPIDVMHLVYLGLTRDIVALLNGSYFPKGSVQSEINHPYRISDKVYKEIGKEMANTVIPTSFGRQMRNIEKYIKSFKSKKCTNFLHNISLLLPRDCVPEDVWTMFLRLVLGISLAVSYTITDVMEIRNLFRDFIKDYY
jgi:hypothetical protein